MSCAHPTGVRPGAAGTVAGMAPPVGRLDVVALDCPDPHALARLYQGLTGGEVVEHPAGHPFCLVRPWPEQRPT